MGFQYPFRSVAIKFRKRIRIEYRRDECEVTNITPGERLQFGCNLVLIGTDFGRRLLFKLRFGLRGEFLVAIGCLGSASEDVVSESNTGIALPTKLKFKASDGKVAFSLGPEDDGAKLVDGEECEITRFNLRRQAKGQTLSRLS